MNQVLTQIQVLLPGLTVLDEPLPASELLRTLVHRYQVRGKNIHDANVVAVMLTHGVRRLATFNSADFRRFDEIVLEMAPVVDSGDAT